MIACGMNVSLNSGRLVCKQVFFSRVFFAKDRGFLVQTWRCLLKVFYICYIYINPFILSLEDDIYVWFLELKGVWQKPCVLVKPGAIPRWLGLSRAHYSAVDSPARGLRVDGDFFCRLFFGSNKIWWNKIRLRWSRLMFCTRKIQGFGWEKLSGQSFVINWQKPGKDACDLSSWILMEGAFNNYQKQHVQDWFFAHARPSWMGVSFMDWSRYSNTAWSSSAVAGRGGFQSFSWDGSNILLPCFVCESFTLFEAFEAATNPAEKSDILRQILTLPNTFLFLLILDLHPRLGVFWFDHRISECLRRLRSSFCFFFVIMRFGDHFRTWRLVRRYGLSCLGGRACMGGLTVYMQKACPLAGLQDFECLRPLDELHHVTSFYTGMSNVPWRQPVGIGIGDGIEVLLEQTSSQAAVWWCFRVKIDVSDGTGFPSHHIFMVQNSGYITSWNGQNIPLFTRVSYIQIRWCKKNHPSNGNRIHPWDAFGTKPIAEVGAFEVNNGLFAAQPRCLWMGRVSSISRV